jgi:BirA family biotin operon repressor/biotin-[acetyl-CoA-carboxylase] ligase
MKSDDHGMSQIERTLIEKGFARQRRVLYLPETDSTNDDAARIAAEGAAAGSIVVAGKQRRGRGRLGKKWLAQPGSGLTFSYIARPEVIIRDVPRLTLAAGLAVANAIEAQTGLATTIKWPNDILINGRKVAGLLCEFHGSGPVAAESPVVIIGIGINISSTMADFPTELSRKATSLTLAGARDVSPADLLICVVRHLEEQLQHLTAMGFPTILADWRKKDATRGRRMVWVDTSGRMVEGFSLGPNDEGGLQIVLDSGRIVQALSGDLSLAEEEIEK